MLRALEITRKQSNPTWLSNRRFLSSRPPESVQGCPTPPHKVLEHCVLGDSMQHREVQITSAWLLNYIHEHGGVMTVTTELVAD